MWFPVSCGTHSGLYWSTQNFKWVNETHFSTLAPNNCAGLICHNSHHYYYICPNSGPGLYFVSDTFWPSLYSSLASIKFSYKIQVLHSTCSVCTSYYAHSKAYCVYCTRHRVRCPQVSCSKIRNMPLKACSRLLTPKFKPRQMCGFSVAPVSGTSTSISSPLPALWQSLESVPTLLTKIPYLWWTSDSIFSVDADNFAELSHRFVPNETANGTKQCLKLLQEWTCARNAISSFERVSAGIWVTVTSSFLNGSTI